MPTMGATWFLFGGMGPWGYRGECRHCLFVGHTQDKNICSTIYYFTVRDIAFLILLPNRYSLYLSMTNVGTLWLLFSWGLYRSR